MDWKDERIKALEQIIEESQAINIKRIEELQAIIAERDATIAKLIERIAELERRLELNSSNSGKPPSSDGLQKPSRIQNLREKSGKKPGGQPGHKGFTLKQIENPDTIKSHKTTHCPHCNTNLTNIASVGVCTKQVFDIPATIKPIITEHQFEIKRCPKCKKRVHAQEKTVAKAPVQYGPTVRAFASYLSVFNLVPEYRTAQIMKDLFGIPMSVATVEGFSKTCANTLIPVVGQIEERLESAPSKGVDESGLRIAGKTYWVHTLCNNKCVHYRVSKKRSDIPNNLTGTVVHDCFSPYFKLDGVDHALCNAHLIRELKACVDIDKEAWARDAIRLLTFALRVSRETPQNITTQWLAKFKKLWLSVLCKGLIYHDQLGTLKKSGRGRIKRRPGHNLLLRLVRYSDDILRFLTNPNAPFTNNVSEQALRMIKVKQKISGCFRTLEGANNFLTIRSYLASAQKQEINVLSALGSVYRGCPISLISS